MVAEAASGRIVLWNPGAEALFGYSAEEALSLSTDQLVPESLRGAHAAGRQRYAATGGRFRHADDVFEFPARTRSGAHVEIEFSLSPCLTHRTGQYVLAVIRDVTERRQAEQRLAASEARFKALVQKAMDLIMVLEASGILRYASPAVTQLLGYRPEELVGSSVASLLHPADAALVVEALGRMVAGQSQSRIEFRARHADGSWRTLEVVGSNHVDAPEVEGIVINARDVTERRQADELLRRQNAYLAALHETTLALLNRLDLKDLLTAIIARAASLLQTEHGYIYLVEPNGESMSAVAGTGYFRERLGTRIRYGEGAGGRVWQTGETLLVADYASWDGRVPGPSRDTLHALLAIPLRSEARVVGVIGLCMVEPGRQFTETEATFLSQFAELASLAYGNARLYTAAQQEIDRRERVEQEREQLLARERAARAEAEALIEIARRISCSVELEQVLQTVAEAALGLVQADLAQVGQSEGEGLRIVALAGNRTEHFRGMLVPRGVGLAGQVLRTGDACQAFDFAADRAFVRGPELDAAAVAEGVVSVLALPIRHATTVVGTLLVMSRQPRTFQPQEIALLERLSLQAAVAIDNAQARERLARLAYRDELTGLDNRRTFDERLTQEILRSRRYAYTCSLLVIDVDHFKRVNDSYGHQAGDIALRRLAGLIESQIRASDRAARYGGEEFAVILPQTDSRAARPIADRIRELIESTPVESGADVLSITVSIGIAAYPGSGKTAAELFASADRALYRAKQSGRNQVHSEREADDTPVFGPNADTLLDP